jgi:hypothetical protein
MIVVVCLPCKSAIRVMPESVASMESVRELDQLVGTRSEFWPDKYLCPLCSKPARGLKEREVDAEVLSLMTVQEATPKEAFAAFNGLGFPDEHHCSLDTVQALLKEQPVRRIIGTDVRGAERTIIDALELWDGTRVYFGAGAQGAVIYRITRPVSYAGKQLEKTS